MVAVHPVLPPLSVASTVRPGDPGTTCRPRQANPGKKHHLRQETRL